MLLLTACGEERGPVPDALLTPAECPAVPEAPSDRALGRYIVGLASCAEARGGQIEAVAEILRGGR